MNIILIGMSGAGKSTLGVLLAKALRLNFIDTDIVIQQQQGRLLQNIIDRDGIEKFIEIEEKTVSGLNMDHCVIATGGSVVYSEKAMKKLKQNGLVLYLHVSYDKIIKRLANITTRGIVIKSGKDLKDVYDERVPLYMKYSDKIVDCSDEDIEQCINKIINVLK